MKKIRDFLCYLWHDIDDWTWLVFLVLIRVSALLGAFALSIGLAKVVSGLHI